MALQSALSRVRDAPFLLDAVRAADELTVAAGQDGGPQAVKVLVDAIAPDEDQVLSIAAVHALGAVFDDVGGRRALRSAVRRRSCTCVNTQPGRWARGTRGSTRWPVGRRGRAGGFATVINQRALRRWAQTAPEHIALALEGALLAQESASARTRLVDTLGLVPGAVATLCPGTNRERCSGAGAGHGWRRSPPSATAGRIRRSSTWCGGWRPPGASWPGWPGWPNSISRPPIQPTPAIDGRG